VLTTLSVIFALNLYLFYGVTGEPPPAMRTLMVIDSTVLVAIANWRRARVARARSRDRVGARVTVLRSRVVSARSRRADRPRHTSGR
jgi:hypothetical protein